MSRIGRAIIEVLLKTDQAKAEVRAVKTELDKLKSGTGGDSGGLPDEFLRVKQALEEAKGSAAGLGTEVGGAGVAAGGLATAMLGVASAIAAAVAGFKLGEAGFSFFDGIINRAEDARIAIDEMNAGMNRGIQDSAKRASLGGASSLTREIDAIESRAQAEVEAYNKAVEAKLGSDTERGWNKVWGLATKAGPFQGLGPSQNNDAIEATRQQKNAQRIQTMNLEIEAAKARAAEEQAKADEEAGKRQSDASQRRVEALGLSQLEGLERLYTEENLAVDDLKQKRMEARSDEAKAALAHEIEIVKQSFIARRGAFLQNEAAENTARERRAQEEENRAKAMAERVAKHQADVLARELERVTNALISNFNQNVNAQQAASNAALGSMTSDVSRIAEIVSLRLRANGIDMR